MCAKRVTFSDISVGVGSRPVVRCSHGDIGGHNYMGADGTLTSTTALQHPLYTINDLETSIAQLGSVDYGPCLLCARPVVGVPFDTKLMATLMHRAKLGPQFRMLEGYLTSVQQPDRTGGDDGNGDDDSDDDDELVVHRMPHVAGRCFHDARCWFLYRAAKWGPHSTIIASIVRTLPSLGIEHATQEQRAGFEHHLRLSGHLVDTDSVADDCASDALR